MSSSLEGFSAGKPPREQLMELEVAHKKRRDELLAQIARADEEAQRFAKNDIHLESDPVAHDAVRTGRDARGETIPDLMAFLKERRQENIDRPPKGTSGIRRAEDLPRDVRADDPNIWERGTGNK